MDFKRKLPIRTSGLNAQLLNHAANRSRIERDIIPSGFVPQIDGIDHAPALKTLPSPIFKIAPSTDAIMKPTKGSFFTDLFAARKVNNE